MNSNIWKFFFRYLDKERQRLVEARRRVEEQRRALLNTMSPTGKPLLSFQNDASSYQKFFENRESRIKESFVLPISKEFPKTEKWKFKIKFVPMPIDGSEIWNKYKKEIVKENEAEVDEAVKAFQSFTQNKKASQRHAYHRVRYFPQFTPEDHSQRYNKHRTRTPDPYKEFLWRSKNKHLAFAHSFDKFRDSMKFVLMHDGYRKNKEENYSKIQEKDTYIGDKYTDVVKDNEYENDPQILKAKFRPAGVDGKPYRNKSRNFYRTF